MSKRKHCEEKELPNKKISADEAAVYDRQIRLLGAEAQKRCGAPDDHAKSRSKLLHVSARLLSRADLSRARSLPYSPQISQDARVQGPDGGHVWDCSGDLQKRCACWHQPVHCRRWRNGHCRPLLQFPRRRQRSGEEGACRTSALDNTRLQHMHAVCQALRCTAPPSTKKLLSRLLTTHFLPPLRPRPAPSPPRPFSSVARAACRA